MLALPMLNTGFIGGVVALHGRRAAPVTVLAVCCYSYGKNRASHSAAKS